MNHLAITGCGLLLLSALWTALPAPPAGAGHESHAGTGDGPGPDGVCATGCAAAPAGDADLSAREFSELLAVFAGEPLAGGSPALEELLFRGAAARGWLAELGPEALAGLDAKHADFLRRELARTHARLFVRVIDAGGRERFALDGLRVPLGEKQHLHPERALDLQVPEISGTVQRVGVDHLWTRL